MGNDEVQGSCLSLSSPWILPSLGWTGPGSTGISLLRSFFASSLQALFLRWALILHSYTRGCYFLPTSNIRNRLFRADASQCGLCPLAKNTKELGHIAGCQVFSFQYFVAILLPITCYLWILGRCRHPAISLFRMLKASAMLSFSHQCIQCGSYCSHLPHGKQTL